MLTIAEITYDFAKNKFEKVLLNVLNGGNPVREVVTRVLNNDIEIQDALAIAPKHTALWQHTPEFHTALIYIPKRTGRDYNRDMLDLIGSGVDSVEKFKFAWNDFNDGKEKGLVPKVNTSVSANSRKRHRSYIVADLSKGVNPNSKIRQHLSEDVVDRTHLISAQTTGIENHRGLLIDYDGWLNRTPMNTFEDKALDLSYLQDIIWRAFIYRTSEGLVWEYFIYDANFKVLRRASWVDDRWTYLWYYDEYQETIGK